MGVTLTFGQIVGYAIGIYSFAGGISFGAEHVGYYASVSVLVTVFLTLVGTATFLNN